MSDLVIFSGRTAVLALGPVTRPDAAGVAQPIDLTAAGIKLWFTVKEAPADLDADAVFQKTWVAPATAGGITVLATGDKNTGTITVAAADTDDIESVAIYVWDLLLEESGGRRTTLDEGPFKVRVGVGQPA